MILMAGDTLSLDYAASHMCLVLINIGSIVYEKPITTIFIALLINITHVRVNILHLVYITDAVSQRKQSIL